MNGLFGTPASLLTDIGLILVQLSMVLALIARYFILKKKPVHHFVTMVSGILTLYLFLFFYVLNYALNGVKTFGGPDDVKLFYYIFLIIHIIGAIIMGGLCTTLLYRSIKRVDLAQETPFGKFPFEKPYRSWHKRMGRIGVYLWTFTALSGLAVYIMLYVLYAPEHVVI